MNHSSSHYPIPSGILGSLTQVGVEEFYLTEPDNESILPEVENGSLLPVDRPQLLNTLRRLYSEGQLTEWAFWELCEALEL